MLRTRLTLKPGAPGTKALAAEYGERLICVRYRYDPESSVRVKTVELIVDSQPWIPRALRPPKPAPLDYVHISVPDPLAAETRTALKRLGGIWHFPTRTWRITYTAVKLLKLTDYIVPVPTPADTPI